jgi:hypothetical protein
MPARIHFSKTDIGGELLPILTTGLYRNTLDTLREYIQNSIDARAENVELVIDPDTVAVIDDGLGMAAAEARQALRLGLSEKNPTEDVGFRGIGIYSAFNLCDTLEIFTKREDSSTGYYLKFDFKTVRRQLLADQERRKRGLKSNLFLEKLLEGNVYVEPDSTHAVEDRGTKVIMSGIASDSYRSLLDWKTVESYLQDVVPLPFNPTFSFGKKLEKKFEEEDYRVVSLELQINARKENIFRPYTNDLFTNGGLYAPKFFPLRRGSTRFGFAWVCINDERRVLKDQGLRGLLIKKFGFSIASRAYLEPFFSRTVFNRRITGEIIIQHPNLLPNAARSDFENNSTRQKFLELLPDFIKVLSAWANKIQQEEKGREVLETVGETLSDIYRELPTNRRDKDKLLEYNVTLADQEHKLETHKKTLQANNELKSHYRKVLKTLKECKAIVRDGLSKNVAASRRLESEVVKSIQAEVEATARPRGGDKRTPGDLTSVLEAAGFPLSSELRTALKAFDSECLRANVDQSTYESILAEFRDILDERF